MSKKMQWTKPQLIILARGTSEEAVLAVCKQQWREYEIPGEGPARDADSTCFKYNPSENCGACQGVTGS